jgi:glycosyltransferase involved in cell wall biosynthesis
MPSGATPSVSVIIPVFNGAATICEALDSVFAQTSSDFEVIVINDGSTDATRALLRGYEGKATILDQPNRGPATARNVGIRASRGEYLAFLDADDKWQPSMLERTVPILQRDPECVLVYTDLAVVDSTGQSLNTSLVGKAQAYAPSMEDLLARMWPIMPSAVVMRRSAFESAGGFCEEFTTANYEDAHFWLLAREQGPFRYVPECLAIWRFSLFPKALKRTGGNPESSRIFARLVEQRYSVSAAKLVGARTRAARSMLGFLGLSALRRGDRQLARRAFSNALHLDPLRVKNYLRFVRTFLPAPLIGLLTGRTRNLKSSVE